MGSFTVQMDSRTWGIISLLGLAAAFSGKLSMIATRIILVITWAVFVRMVYKAYDWHTSRNVITTVCGVVGLLCLLGYDRWLQPEKLFCYLHLDKPGSVAHKEASYQMAMQSNGIIEHVLIYPSPFGTKPDSNKSPREDPYYSLRNLAMNESAVYQGGRIWPLSLPIGDYRIDFATKSGNWYEHLKIYEIDGVVKESIVVTTEPDDAGEVIFRN